MKINIGKFARWSIRQVLGTEKGNMVIDFVEGGLLEAGNELIQGDIKGFLDALPAEIRTKIINYVLSILPPRV